MIRNLIWALVALLLLVSVGCSATVTVEAKWQFASVELTATSGDVE